MMKSTLLYPRILIGVLLFGGCAQKSGDSLPDNGNMAEVETSAEGSLTLETGKASKSESASGSASIEFSEARTESARILFLGDSITAGFGVEQEEAFPSLIQKKITASGLPFLVVDAGFSGETSSGGLSRIPWLLRAPIDVLVLELGGNDGLRGIATNVTRRNLSMIIEKTRAEYPNVRIILAGMQVPPNLGHEYTASFRDIYPALAEKYHTELIPFVLEGVGGVPGLNQPDQIHPTAAGHVIVADNVWKVLEPVLESLKSSS